MSRPVLFFVLAMVALTHSPSEWPVAGPSGLAAEAAKPIRISVAIRNRSLANPVQKDIRITPVRKCGYGAQRRSRPPGAPPFVDLSAVENGITSCCGKARDRTPIWCGA
jgi:hypothetical protein